MSSPGSRRSAGRWTARSGTSRRSPACCFGIGCGGRRSDRRVEMSSESLPEKLDVLAVGPHPDDLEITCGGTLAKLVKLGYRVGMIDLTSGEPTPRGTPEVRQR